MLESRRLSGTETGWGTAAAAGLAANAAWLRDPTQGYLFLAAAATAGAALFAARMLPGRRRWPLLGSAVALAAVFVGGAAERSLKAIDTTWPAYQVERSARVASVFRDAIGGWEVRLRARAADALDAPADPARAFAFLDGRTSAGPEQGIVLYRGATAVAWTGQVRVPIDTVTGPIGVDSTAFYLVMYATASRGDLRAVATVLVSATPPADRFAPALDETLVGGSAVAGFEYVVGRADTTGGAIPIVAGETTMFSVRPRMLQQGHARVAVVERATATSAALLAFALTILIAVTWRRSTSVRARGGALAVGLACLTLVPLNVLSNKSPWFDPAIYYARLGSAFSASAGALALAGALVLLGLFGALRSPRWPRSRWAAVMLVVATAAGGPFLMRDLARGIHPPAWGVSAPLWLSWEVALFLAGMSVLLAGVSAGRAAIRGWRGLPLALGPGLSAVAAIAAPLLWEGPGRWPGWYPILWIAAIGALALARRARRVVLATAVVASLGATTLVWGRVIRGRMDLAAREVGATQVADPTADTLLARFSASLEAGPPPLTRAELLRLYVVSDLAAADYPAALALWPSNEGFVTRLALSEVAVDSDAVGRTVDDALTAGTTVQRALSPVTGRQLIAAVPFTTGTAVSIAIAPKTRLSQDDPFLSLLGIVPATVRDPPYTVTMSALDVAADGADSARWERVGDVMRGDWRLAGARARIDVDLPSLDAAVQRGALILVANLLLVAALWMLGVSADGSFHRWVGMQRRVWRRSYRARLTVVLLAFFVVPALLFAGWAYRGIRSADREARERLVRETLRPVAAGGAASALALMSQRLETPLLLYRDGELETASDLLYQTLAPFGRFLPPDVYTSLVIGEDATASRFERVGPMLTLIGYRSASVGGPSPVVVAAPARANATEPARRESDLAVLVLFITVSGALAALWLSGVAARQLAQPIRSLRGAALAIARGEREPPLTGEPPAEFGPVFSAFRRMATDLDESRTALEATERRTAAILRNVASGVVAVDREGIATLVNPSAREMLGRAAVTGEPLDAASIPAISREVDVFLDEDADEREFDVELGDRHLHARITRLTRGAAGAVVTLDDVTEVARAQRVLAWGEMARQVAHEIKNPLTPIRLGVQHLRRAYVDRHPRFDTVLEQNVARILAEIDRLDEIAKRFSRYGPTPPPPPEGGLDVAAVVHDVVALESMGAGGVVWRLEQAPGPVPAQAREDELREVVLNVLENARQANATTVDIAVCRRGDRAVITVQDNGDGIPALVLPRIFEPHFSTRTSGSGLGLAISRRLIEGWGGTITIESGKGTKVEIALVGVGTEQAER